MVHQEREREREGNMHKQKSLAPEDFNSLKDLIQWEITSVLSAFNAWIFLQQKHINFMTWFIS